MYFASWWDFEPFISPIEKVGGMLLGYKGTKNKADLTRTEHHNAMLSPLLIGYSPINSACGILLFSFSLSRS